MTNFPFLIDLHCHPNHKPFARAHQQTGRPPVVQPASPSNPASLWFYEGPSVTDKLLNIFLSITKFRQTNLTAAHYGNLRVMVVGLGAVEKFFFKHKLGTGIISDLVNDFISGFRKPRVDAIQNMKDYWADLQNEIRFMNDAAGKVVKIDGKFHTYKIAENFADLLIQQQANEDPKVGSSRAKPWITSLIFSCEGLHVLGCGLETPCNPISVKENALALKQSPLAPWFVTFTHHFYNELCGQARSLHKQVEKLTDQEEGIGMGFTSLGKEVLDILLNKEKGRRILIDVKHMSPQGRKEFYDLRKSVYNSEIPIFMSHGVANGLPTYGATESVNYELGSTFINPIEFGTDVHGKVFAKDHNEINFYDDELIEMVKSQGIIGFQLDERRVANEKALGAVKKSLLKHKTMHYRSELIWRQVQYIAELLDKNGLYAWGNMAIGSDYDGLVDPLNSFWTAEEYDDLMQYLERHAWEYVKKIPHPMKQDVNKISADKIVENIFSNNAWAFFSRWF